MDNLGFLKDMFESIPGYRNIVFLVFLIKNDVYLSCECGYLKWILIVFVWSFKNFYLNKIRNVWNVLKMKKNQLSRGF